MVEWFVGAQSKIKSWFDLLFNISVSNQLNTTIGLDFLNGDGTTAALILGGIVAVAVVALIISSKF